jgi:hypothetical protein
LCSAAGLSSVLEQQAIERVVLCSISIVREHHVAIAEDLSTSLTESRPIRYLAGGFASQASDEAASLQTISGESSYQSISSGTEDAASTVAGDFFGALKMG